jgi:integrase
MLMSPTVRSGTLVMLIALLRSPGTTVAVPPPSSVQASATGADATAGKQLIEPLRAAWTCARLCHASGGELEQIQFLLGHVSVQTTERYLGCKQRLRSAVNDHIGIEPHP